MTMKKIIISTVILFLATGLLKAQDFHLAQYESAGLYMNPALTGIYDDYKGDYKVYSNIRSQWRSFGIKPFFTTFLAYDMPLTIKQEKIGVGAYFINNRTGPGNLNTTGFMFSGAYNILDKKAYRKHILSAGLQLGLFHKSINNSDLFYDQQYSYAVNGGSFDQNINSGEEMGGMNIVRFDANLGLFYKLTDPLKKHHPYAGISLSHLNRANESFTDNDSRLPIRFTFHGGCDFKLDDKFDLTPRLLIMNQAKAYEYNFGVLGFYKINDAGMKAMCGIDYRVKDAVIIHAGMKQDNYYVRFSYDINSSYLNRYTNYRGAWEISLIYTGEKGKSFFKTIPKF